VRSITDLMILPGLINLDFADVRAVMSEMGKAMMGTGEAAGEDRALQAAQNAIANPLLDETSLKGAKAVLVNITGGMDMTLLEVDEAANAISAEVDQDANIIFGAAFDPALDGKIRVSVVATGMDDVAAQILEPAGSARPVTPPTYGARPVEPLATRPEPIIRPAEPRRVETREPVMPTFSAPTPRAPEPAPVQTAARAEAPRELEPIVDPWVEEYEAERPASRAPVAQGDLYLEPTPARRAETPVQVDEDDWDDRDHHRKTGWSLFGRKRAAPQAPTYGAPTRGTTSGGARTATATAQVQEPEPQTGDDLEIPSFLRRLAN
jgi:cell division protein FtsZ